MGGDVRAVTDERLEYLIAASGSALGNDLRQILVYAPDFLVICEELRRARYGRRRRVSVYFDGHDAWVGLYWKRDRAGRLVWYVCLLPFVVLRVCW
jgi:hypothetical protein